MIDRGAIGSINGRSREGRFLRAYEKMLFDHVGGSPDVAQRVLIARAARMALHLELMDERALLDAHPFGVHDCNYYVAWSNTLARILKRLGVPDHGGRRRRKAAAAGPDPLAALRAHVAAQGTEAA